MQIIIKITEKSNNYMLRQFFIAYQKQAISDMFLNHRLFSIRDKSFESTE